MDVKEFDYELDESLIAQRPIEAREQSRLMTVNRNSGEIEHKHFFDILDYLNKGDVLVLNDTKVMPSRIYGNKVDTNAKIEFLLLKETSKDVYQCLAKPFRRIKVGTLIDFDGLMKASVISKAEDGICEIKFEYKGIFIEILEKLGEMPLPPYIHEKLEDKDRYQTVYAKNLGSAAAPTAGLHFTKELLKKIKDKGVEIEYVTLHVGLGTFRPMQTEKVEEHHMHSEYYEISEDVANRLNIAKQERRRIIAVGTTSTRTLESNITKYNKFTATKEDTSIFIYPGYEFKAIDCLITNFHLPKSTLVMLVSAFASKDIIMKAYMEAQKERYRFFSFGDAMYLYK